VKDIESVFAHNLRELRGKLTQEQVCEGAGIPYPTYQRMESGKIPQEHNLKAIARFYGVPETRLFLDPDLLPKTIGASELRAISSQLDVLKAQVSAALARDLEEAKSTQPFNEGFVQLRAAESEVHKLPTPAERIARLTSGLDPHQLHSLENAIHKMREKNRSKKKKQGKTG